MNDFIARRQARNTSTELRREIEAFRKSYTRGKYNQLQKKVFMTDSHKDSRVAINNYDFAVKVKTELQSLVNRYNNDHDIAQKEKFETKNSNDNDSINKDLIEKDSETKLQNEYSSEIWSLGFDTPQVSDLNSKFLNALKFYIDYRNTILSSSSKCGKEIKGNRLLSGKIMSQKSHRYVYTGWKDRNEISHINKLSATTFSFQDKDDN